MKKSILVLFLMLSTTIFANNDCIKEKVERLNEARVKVITYNKCENVTTIRTYLINEWRKIERDRKKLKKEKKVSPKKVK